MTTERPSSDSNRTKNERIAALNVSALSKLREDGTIERLDGLIEHAANLKRAIKSGDPGIIRGLGFGLARAERGFALARELSGTLRQVSAGNAARVGEEDAAIARAEEERKAAAERAIAEHENRKRRAAELRALLSEFPEDAHGETT